MRRALIVVAALVALAAGVGWARWRFAPSVLLIGIGGLRADQLSETTTPNLLRLARAGVEFSDAVSPGPWVRAASVGVLTGHFPSSAGIRSPLDRVSPLPATLAEQFLAAGYRTAAIVSSFDLDHVFGLDRGFESYDDRCDAAVLGDMQAPSRVASLYFGDPDRDRSLRATRLSQDGFRANADTVDAALGALQDAGGAPMFLWVSLFGTGRRWPDRWSQDTILRQYAKSLEDTDKQLGRLLEGLAQLRLANRTLLVVYGETGQALLDHRTLATGQELYQSSLRVPLLVQWPGHIPAGVRWDAPVSLLDIAPTLRELCGLPAKPGRGASLGGVLLHGQAPPERPLFAETWLGAVSPMLSRFPDTSAVAGVYRRAVRWGRWKLIRAEPHALIDSASAASVEAQQGGAVVEELYDLQEDPGEQRNLAPGEMGTVHRLRDQMVRLAADPTE